MSTTTIHTIRPVNLTPHPVNLHLADGRVVTIDPALPEEEVPRLVISDGQATALAVAGPDGESTIVPVKVGGRVTAIDPPLPDPVPGTVHIVARVVAAQAPERDDLVWPDDLIRGDRGRVVGCRALGAARRPAAALTAQEITLLTDGGGEQEPEA